MKYDYLIVGAGLYGAVCAHELAKRGKRCLVVEKRNHIGGNIYTKEIEGINVHMYGAHIFHTSDKKIWEYISQFAEFNHYINAPVARYHDELYNLPFNMNTFTKLWPDVFTPEDAKRRIEKEREMGFCAHPSNLKEQAISLVGETIYKKLIEGYTEKQWGKKCEELPAFIIKRLPVRFTFDNNYFNDRYQGIPIGGYTQIIAKMLEGSDVLTEYDYFEHRDELKTLAEHTIYTGPIDRFYDFAFGALEYRSVRFETEILDMESYQGNAVVNYTAAEVPYTRIIEHKHFEFGTQPKTVISREYSSKWTLEDEPYYPLNDAKNTMLYDKYKAKADAEPNVTFGGRLGAYKYYDMHVVIAEALKTVAGLTNED